MEKPEVVLVKEHEMKSQVDPEPEKKRVEVDIDTEEKPEETIPDRGEISEHSSAIINVYNEYKDFLLIGLTGRTGSGCSTSARILSSGSFNLPESSDAPYLKNESRKYKIIKKYINKQENLQFHHLQVKTIITDYIVDLGFDDFCTFYSKIAKIKVETVKSELSKIKWSFDKATILTKKINSKIEIGKPEDLEEAYVFYTETLPYLSEEIKLNINKLQSGSYIKTYQIAGDNIRSSDNAASDKFEAKHVMSFPNKINHVIKLIRDYLKSKNKPCYIVIDAIRNPYEAIFFKNRYSNFYLISINTDNKNRLKHLKGNLNFTTEQIDELDRKEYPAKLKGHHKYISQNIQKCIEISDIHINNPKDDAFGDNDLRCQLAWYIALMFHPGLVMPTSTESCMQIAYSAKMNSGCISRQVGAAITNTAFSVKAIGWNNTPQGQVPCLLRNAEDLIFGIDSPAYSTYERNDKKFRKIIKEKYDSLLTSPLLNGRNISYCFKDLQNQIEEEKNQVHTRSLHAEENAFLQTTKYGGQSILGGFLFTTASPCELCAKKAYQLGISKIIYVDPYPGIATEHIIQCGDSRPKLELFRGAIGKAFHRLYQPIMPFKDELEVLLNIKPHEYEDKRRISELEDENKALKEKLKKLEEQKN